MIKSYGRMGKNGGSGIATAVLDPSLLSYFRFKVNPASGKASLYSKIGGKWSHTVDFGSVSTNEYVSTVPMGGLKYRHTDGYNYNIARISPTGEGLSAVIGNYASPTYLVSDIGGLWHTYETQNWFEDTYNGGTVTATTSKDWSITIDMDVDRMHYGGSVYIPESTEDVHTLMRMWVTDTATGKILHETVTKDIWDNSIKMTELRQKQFGAKVFSYSAGDTTANLATSIPFPVAKDDGARTWHWSFRDPITLISVDADNPKFLWGNEEIIREQVATREWVKGASVSVRTINKDSTEEEKTIKQGENILIGDLTGNLVIGIDEGATFVKVRDMQEFIYPYTVTIFLDFDNSIELNTKGDYVDIYKIDDVQWAYYDHLKSASFLIPPAGGGSGIGLG